MSRQEMSLSHPRLGILVQQARGNGPIRVGVVYPCEANALTAALEAAAFGFIQPVLIGPRALIQKAAAQAGADISQMAIVESAASPNATATSSSRSGTDSSSPIAQAGSTSNGQCHR